MTSPQKTKLKTFYFFKSKLEDFLHLTEFEQLSSSLGWHVMVVQEKCSKQQVQIYCTLAPKVLTSVATTLKISLSSEVQIQYFKDFQS